MKKLDLVIMVFTILTAVASSAYCAEGFYVGGYLGGAALRDFDETISDGEDNLNYEFESKIGLALGVAAGYDFGNNFRAEAEVAYQKNDSDKVLGSNPGESVTVNLTDYMNFEGDTSSLAILANGYYLLPNQSSFTPFISAGLGFAEVNLSLSLDFEGIKDEEDDDDTVFAYQIGAGFDYAVNEKFFISAKYRYFATSDPEFSKLDDIEIDYSSHNFYAGLRVAF